MFAEQAMLQRGAEGTGYGQPECAPAPSASMIAAFMSDLSEAIGLSANLSAQLYDVRMNLFGPWPQKDSGAQASPDPQSVEQKLALALSILRRNLLEAQDHASVIRTRL